MKLWSDSYPEGGRLPEKYPFGKYHPDFHIEMCDNISPHFAWSDVPVDTKTFVFTSHILNTPTDPENINVIGKFIPVDVDRPESYLWTCVDLPASTKSFDEGVFSHEITPCRVPCGESTLVTMGLAHLITMRPCITYSGHCMPWIGIGAPSKANSLTSN